MFASSDISILIANIKSGICFVFKSRCHTTKITSRKLISSTIKHATDVILERHTCIRTKINQIFEMLPKYHANFFKIKWREMHKFMILLLQMKTHFSNGNVKWACNCFALKAQTTISCKSVITILHLGRHNIKSQ